MNTTLQPIAIAQPTAMKVLTDLPMAVVKLIHNKGKFVSIVTRRPLKVRKGCSEIIKESEFVCRVSVEYDNQKAVVEKRENGDLPEENQGLIGREWVCYPIILCSIKSGKYMVRCAPVHNNPNNKKTTRFIRNGVEITREDAAKDAYASEFAEREPTDAFDITVDNIITINGECV